jgi:hypothetical protein
MRGGVLTWADVNRIDPDYIVLSSSLYGAAWMKNLIATQRFERSDPREYNVRLYQDLLLSDEPGRTNIPRIQLEKIIRPQGRRLSAAMKPIMARLGAVCADWWFCEENFADQVKLGTDIERRIRLLADNRAEPLSGPELRIYRIRKGKAFGAGTAAGYNVANAFDHSTTAWACAYFGSAAKQCSIGYDFGAEDKTSVKAVEVQWVYGLSTPPAFNIEYSDDNVIWTSGARMDVREYPADTPNFRIDSFSVPDCGPHRYWRLTISEMPDNVGFAIAELKFL